MANYVNNSGQIRLGWRVPTVEQLQTATYLLDSYSGASAAYSLRKLNSSYSGSAIRVRRSIDNLEQNIGFDGSGNLDTTGLLSFVNLSDTTTSKLLDQYGGSSVAYSLRKLSATYSGSAIRVRRSSDNQEMNIGFDVSGNLDTVSLLSFVGSGNGFVTAWYDQSSNNNHATQNVSNLQPQIVSVGSILLVNNKPSIRFDNSLLNLTSLISLNNSNYHSFVGSRASTSDKLYGLSGQNGYKYVLALWSDNKYYLQAKTNAYQPSNSTDNSIGQLLLTGRNINGVMSIYKNSNIIPSTEIFDSSINPSITGIGQYFNSFNNAKCSLQEMVFYNNNQTSQVNIESNMNSYYSIYSQSNNGFVTTWYDQSGNGRHATQTTSSYQPEIVSSGSVLTSLGKPTLRFGNVAGGVTYLENTTLSMNTSDVSYVYLANKLSAGTSGNAFSIPLALRSNLTNVGIFDWNSLNNIGSRMNGDNTVRIYYNSNNIQGSYSYNTNYIIWNQKLGSQLSLSRNGVTQSTTTLAQSSNITSSIISLGGSSIHTSDSNLNGYLTEAILYPSNQTSNKSLIEGNINGYYSLWDSSIVQSGLVLNLDASFKSSYSGTGSTWTDISYNGYNGTMINGVGYTASNGGVMTFDGVNDYVTVSYTIQTQFTNKLTINAWVKPSWFDTGNGDGVNILSKCAPSLSPPYTLFGLSIAPDGAYGGTIGNGSVRSTISSTNKLTLNNWVNICLTYDGSTIKLYKNGVQDPTTVACSYTLGQNTVPITIASHQTLGSYYDWFRGNIGLIQMYNTGLSATEVLQNFNATKSRFGL